MLHMVLLRSERKMPRKQALFLAFYGAQIVAATLTAANFLCYPSKHINHVSHRCDQLLGRCEITKAQATTLHTYPEAEQEKKRWLIDSSA